MAKKKTSTKISPSFPSERLSAEESIGKKAAVKSRKTTKPLTSNSTEAGQDLDCESYPETADRSVRVIQPSADVLFARAKIGMSELLQTLVHPDGSFIDSECKFIDVGYKFVNGGRTADLAVRLHVGKKCVGKPFSKTCFNGRVRTDVLVSNFKLAATQIASGDFIKSDGNPGMAGTLGMGVLMDRGTTESSRTMFLTSAHVLASDQVPPIGDRYDIKDDSGDLVGKAFQFGDRFFRNNDEYDVAIFPSVTWIPADARGRFEHLPVTPTSVNDPTPDDVLNRTRVYKVGARSRLTLGVIDSLGPLFQDIPLENGLVAKDHFLVRSTSATTFADGQDSGAIVVSEDGRIFGMVRAVDEDATGKRTVVTRMTKISAAFEFRPVY